MVASLSIIDEYQQRQQPVLTGFADKTELIRN